MKKKKQDKNKSLTGNPDLDSKPWIPANSLVEAMAKSSKYLEDKKKASKKDLDKIDVPISCPPPNFSKCSKCGDVHTEGGDPFRGINDLCPSCKILEK
jgi:hypothetical protein